MKPAITRTIVGVVALVLGAAIRATPIAAFALVSLNQTVPDWLPSRDERYRLTMCRMSQICGDAKCRDKAIRVAHVLVTNLVPGTANDSPWPCVINS
jgi:hypothetical protein